MHDSPLDIEVHILPPTADLPGGAGELQRSRRDRGGGQFLGPSHRKGPRRFPLNEHGNGRTTRACDVRPSSPTGRPSPAQLVSVPRPSAVIRVRAELTQSPFVGRTSAVPDHWSPLNVTARSPFCKAP